MPDVMVDSESSFSDSSALDMTHFCTRTGHSTPEEILTLTLHQSSIPCKLLNFVLSFKEAASKFACVNVFFHVHVRVGVCCT